MNKLVISWIYSKFITNILFIYIYFKILLSVCVSYDTWYEKIKNRFMIRFMFWQLCRRHIKIKSHFSKKKKKKKKQTNKQKEKEEDQITHIVRSAHHLQLYRCCGSLDMINLPFGWNWVCTFFWWAELGMYLSKRKCVVIWFVNLEAVHIMRFINILVLYPCNAQLNQESHAN